MKNNDDDYGDNDDGSGRGGDDDENGDDEDDDLDDDDDEGRPRPLLQTFSTRTVNLYWDQTAATRINDEISEYKPIKRGVRQGCVLSPDFFNIYSEMILRNIYDLKRIRIGGVNINNLRYADDTVLLAESENELQAIIHVVTDASMEMGLDLNAKKTECMTTSSNADPPHMQSNQQR
ncbi:endonuclease-reverse transcriptase [Elysia marginata]|uniref:Endonuclease-reverse transcriptase n=1 Tax=Elysia marginata TaxID=1093978 RepID=A0AAV4HH21_9GAST|nr:endonuclease-reverse transcriptase [Elysia marginata]